MNTSGIIVLLQLVLALLSNPATAQNVQVQDMAAQAVSLATQALSATTNQTIVNTPPADSTNAPTQNLGNETIALLSQPSCSLIGTAEGVSKSLRGGNVRFDWSLSGINASTTGKLFTWKGNYLRWQPSPFALNDKSRNTILGGLSGNAWKAIFGDIECYAYFPYSGLISEGQMSSSTPYEDFLNY